MRISMLPKTPLGWWSVGLGMPTLLLFTYPLVVRLGPMASFIAAAYFNKALLALGIAALIIGLIATIKNKERSILIFLAMLLGLFDLVFVLGELLFLH